MIYRSYNHNKHCDTKEKWKKISKEAKRLGYNISVSTLLENKCTEEQKAKGYDLGDYLIDMLLHTEQPNIIEQTTTNNSSAQQKQSAVLSEMIEANPILCKLIDNLDLIEV